MFLIQSVATILLSGSVSLAIFSHPPTEFQPQRPETFLAHQSSRGGQVIESGPYHLEFVPEKTAKGTHLDFYLQTAANAKPIPNAQVIAQIQLPDGTQKRLPLTYDAQGKHYTALLASKLAGEYKIAFLCQMGDKRVNGRFTFKK